MITTDKKEIDGYTYEVTQLGNKKGRRLMVRLFKLVGPAAAEFLAALGGKDGKDMKSIGDLSTESLANAVADFADRITEDELDHIVETLAAKTRVNQAGGGAMADLSSDVQDQLWAGSNTTMFKWLAFALEHNYRDFFGGLGSLGALFSRAEAGSPSPSQTSLTGTPTGSPSARDTAAA